MTTTNCNNAIDSADLTCKAGHIAGGSITAIGPNLPGDQVLEAIA